MSEKHVDWRGDEYTETKLADGSIQRNYVRTDWRGNEYTEHTDEQGHTIGKSYDRVDYKGDHYAEHYSPDNRYVGKSVNTTDFSGNERTDYYDKNNNYIGNSTKTKNWNGDEVIELGPKSECDSSASGAVSGTSSSGSVGFAPAYGAILGVQIAISIFICFLSRRSVEIIGLVRYIVQFGLAPVMMLVIIARGHGKKTDSHLAKALKGKAYISSFILFIGLQIFFLFYTDPTAEGSGFLAFALFIGCWLGALIFSIYTGIAERRARKIEAVTCERINETAIICFAVVTSIMELMNMLASDILKDIIGAIIYGVPGLLILFGVVFGLSKLMIKINRRIAGDK